MIYSNPEFLILLVFTAIAFFLSANQVWRMTVLTLASTVFYLWAGIFDAILFFSVVIISWFAMRLAEKFPERKRSLSLIAIGLIAGNLLFWKYSAWVTENIQRVVPSFHDGNELLLPLPIGISFYTLQGIAFLLDYMRGQAKLVDFWRYLIFKGFFAQLIAGPICRSQQLLPQITDLKTPKMDDVIVGVHLIVLGFFKKVAIADRIAPMVDNVFLHSSEYTRWVLIQALVGYSVQIWADFSGYTDMGRGAARILGIRLPENFLSPYLARSPSEFWQRWHITLSEWIRDYIFNPLALFSMRNGGAILLFFSAVLTLVISGLWHGAAWTFLFWGLYHGALLAIERPLRSSKLGSLFRSCLPKILQSIFLILLMNVLVLFAWLLFRAQGLDAVYDYLLAMWIDDGKTSVVYVKNMYVGLLLCMSFQVLKYYDLKKGNWPVWEFCTKQWLHFTAGLRQLTWVRCGFGIVWGLGLAIVFIITVFLRHTGGSSAFIYFQF